jgi:hypothetical protein
MTKLQTKQNDYYTYAYLREDLSPYYVGKGRGDRIFSNDRRLKPPCLDRIMFLREGITEKQAFDHEIDMIKAWGRKDLKTGMLRNMTDGGEGVSGRKISNGTKAKISLAHIGKKHTQETKAKISLIHKGKIISKEHKAKLLLANLRRKVSDETKAKMSLAHKGKILSEEHKAKLSLAHKGKKLSKVHKARIGLATSFRHRQKE